MDRAEDKREQGHSFSGFEEVVGGWADYTHQRPTAKASPLRFNFPPILFIFLLFARECCFLATLWFACTTFSVLFSALQMS